MFKQLIEFVFHSEHQELSKQIKESQNQDIQEDLERELDCLVKQMEIKGEQISKLKKHQDHVRDSSKIRRCVLLDSQCLTLWCSGNGEKLRINCMTFHTVEMPERTKDRHLHKWWHILSLCWIICTIMPLRNVKSIMYYFIYSNTALKILLPILILVLKTKHYIHIPKL